MALLLNNDFVFSSLLLALNPQVDDVTQNKEVKLTGTKLIFLFQAKNLK
jgi:hypothetical protein